MTESDNTGFLLNLLKTTSMHKWLLEFFTYSRRGVAQGWFDEERVIDQFKAKVLEAKPTTLLGMPIEPETVDWPRLYKECNALAQPSDWEKKSLTADLKRRGIDPRSFPWELGPGEEPASLTKTGATEATYQEELNSAVQLEFRRIKRPGEITKEIAPEYRPQVGAAGPVIGALWIRAYLHAEDSPPAPSPVGAHLVEVSFGTFENLGKHLRSDRKRGIKQLGRATYEAWTRNILNIAADPNTLLALSVALFTEGQMTTISSLAQDTLLGFLSPIIEGSSAPLQHEVESGSSSKRPNAEVVAVLHAGQVPFLITCHPAETLKQWWSHLEAATALLIPQLIVAAEEALSEKARGLMMSALAEETRQWRTRRPRMGESANWSWLTKLM